MAQDVKVEVDFKIIENINKNVEKMTKNVSKLGGLKLPSLTSAFKGLSLSIITLNQGLQLLKSAYGAIAAPIAKAINLSAEQQKVETLLAATLKQKRIFTEEVFQANLKLASSLQEVTTYGDEQILQVQRSLFQFGIQQDQIEGVTKAVLDLASAQNLDLNSAAQLVAKSVGSTTNALARYGVVIDNSAKGSQRAAAIVEGIANLFGGSARAEVNTFSGSVKQLDNTWGDFLEILGDFITKNPIVLNGIKGLNKAVQSLQQYVLNNREEISRFIKEGLIELIKATEKFVGFIEDIKNEGLFDAIFSEGKKSAEELETQLNSLIQKKKELQTAPQAGGGGFLGGAVNELSVLDIQIENIKNRLGTIKNAAPDEGSLFGSIRKGLNKLAEDIIDTTDKVKTASENAGKGPGAEDPFKKVFQNLKKGFEDFNIAKAVTGGSAGAMQLAGALGDAIAPGVGTAVQFFGQSQEAFAKQIDGFTQTLIDLPTNIAENIPVFIEKLVEAAPQIMDAISDAAPLLLDRLEELMQKESFQKALGKALAASFIFTTGDPAFHQALALGITEAFIMAIPTIASEFGKELGKTAGDIFKGAGDLVSGGGNILSSVGDFFGFQKGFDVPNNPQYAGDGFGPTMLSAGESVLRKNTSDRLDAFLDEQSRGGRDTSVVINLQVGEQELSKVLLSLNQRGFRVA